MTIYQSNHKSELHIHNNHGDGTTPFAIMLTALTKHAIPINPGGACHLSQIMQNAKDYTNTIELLKGLHDIQTQHTDPYAIGLTIKLNNGSTYNTCHECWDSILVYNSTISPHAHKHGNTYIALEDYVQDHNGDWDTISKHWPINQVEYITLTNAH